MKKLQGFLLPSLYFSLICSFLFVVFLFVTTKTDKIFKLRSFVVLTGSMEPTLPVGSIVITKASDTYQLGEAITFIHKEQTITHRIVSYKTIGSDRNYIVKGDANKSPDADQIPEEEIVGKVVIAIPLLGYFVKNLRSPLGILGFIFLPGLIAIGYEAYILAKEHERIIEKRLKQKFTKELNEFIKNYHSFQNSMGGNT